jgi:hypothetical protein
VADWHPAARLRTRARLPRRRRARLTLLRRPGLCSRAWRLRPRPSPARDPLVVPFYRARTGATPAYAAALPAGILRAAPASPLRRCARDRRRGDRRPCVVRTPPGSDRERAGGRDDPDSRGRLHGAPHGRQVPELRRDRARVPPRGRVGGGAVSFTNCRLRSQAVATVLLKDDAQVRLTAGVPRRESNRINQSHGGGPA